MASDSRLPTPYLPMVKAIAPKAPSGATFMMMPTMPNRTCESLSISSNTGLPFAPNACRAKPNRTENSSTCRISPFANASTTVFGMTFSRNSVVDCILPGPAYCATALVSRLAGSMFIPAPGWNRLMMTRPTSRARVLTASK